MLHLFLLTLLPTLWAWQSARSVLQHFESKLVQLTAAWFFGQFVLVWCCLACAVLIAPYSDRALMPALLISLAALTAGLLRWRFGKCSSSKGTENSRENFYFVAGVVALCLLVSTLFYWHHLTTKEGTIYRSALYWDFPGQFSMVQSFILGNNFPPSNELHSGAPLAYHYFFFLWVALYGVLGGDLTLAVNCSSILAFAAVLVLVVGVAEEFTRNRMVGLIALVLALTTASYRWLDLILDSSDRTFIKRIASPFYRTTSPDSVALTPTRRFGYNGNMFNLFYFLQERQLAIGCILLLLSAVVLLRRNRLTSLQSVIIGSLFGLCVQWHLYCLVIVGGGLLILTILESPRRNALAILAPLGILALGQLLLLRSGIHSDYFTPEFSKVPRFDPRFATAPGKYPLSPANLVLYWYFALGAKVVLIPAGIGLLAGRCSSSMKIMLALLVPAFLLTNTVRFAPLSIFDNHKWIRPALLLSETCSAIALYWLFVHAKKSYRLLGWVLLPVLTLSGVVEGYGYFRPQRMITFAKTSAPLGQEIQSRTSPGAIFASNNPRDVLLSGRTMYVTDPELMGGNPRMDHNFLDIETRFETLRVLLTSKSLDELCHRASIEPIDFLELNLPALIRMEKMFRNTECLWPASQTSFGRWVRVVDLACACAVSR